MGGGLSRIVGGVLGEVGTLSPHNLPQGSLQVGVLVLVPRLQSPLGHHPLALHEHDGPFLAQQRTHDEARDREQGGAAQGAAQSLCELPVGVEGGGHTVQDLRTLA